MSHHHGAHPKLKMSFMALLHQIRSLLVYWTDRYTDLGELLAADENNYYYGNTSYKLGRALCILALPLGDILLPV